MFITLLHKASARQNMKIFKTRKYSIMLGVLRYSFVFILGLTLMFSFGFINAETDTGNGSDTGTKATMTIKNPLNGIDDIPSFIKKLIEIVLYIGVPIVALAIIYTGFLFVQAQGSPEKITKAKSALLYTLIGAALLLGAFVIAQAIKGTVDQLKE